MAKPPTAFLIEPSPRLVMVRSIARAASLAVVLVGALALLGWLLDIATFKSVISGLAIMKANTALAFVLSGVSLQLGREERAEKWARLSARCCAGVVVLFGVLTLGEYLFGWQLGIDQLLFKDLSGSAFPGRMAHATAFNFALFGIALLLFRTRRGYWVASTLVFVALLIAWIAVIGYAYGIASLYAIGVYSSIAIHTALTFILLGVGLLLAQPDRGLVGLAISDTAGGMMLRRLLPAAIVIPAALGWLRWQGQLARLYDTEFGLALMVVSSTIFFAALIWLNARSLYRLDLEGRQVEAALRGSEERFRATFEQAGVGIARVGPQGQWLEVNQKLCDIVGYSRVELFDRTFQDITHPDDLDADLQYVRRVLAGDIQTYTMEKRYIHKDRSLIWINLTVALVREHSGTPKYFISIIEDISERKRTEAALRQAEQALQHNQALLRKILDTNPNIIFVKDRDANIILANRALADSYQMTIAELVGRSQVEVQIQGGMSQVELQQWLADDREVIDTGRPKTILEPYTHRDGSLHWSSTNKFPLDLADGSRGVLIISEDVSERQHADAEVRRMNEELEQRVVARTAELAAANQELEAFSYSVSHDLRAPLRAIDGFSRILLEDYIADLPHEAQHYFQLVRNNTQQMGQLVDDLLAFARLSSQPLSKRSVDPAALVRQCLEELRAEYAERHVAITLGDLPACQADSALLKQVWINLIANALKYTRRREAATIAIGCRAEERATVYFINDNGVGFDMSYSDKLFGVFQRMHRAEDYEGTGVGLAIVQRIIHRHGGRVWAEAAVDCGAAFYFTLGGGTA